jgi:hypothetical protein
VSFHGRAASLQDADGKLLVEGKEGIGFTSGEEEARGLTNMVPRVRTFVGSNQRR